MFENQHGRADHDHLVRRLEQRHPIEPLTSAEFRAQADALFGFNGSEQRARTAPGWLTTANASSLVAFCQQVALAYRTASEVPTGTLE